jgi:hypothetical protein
VIVTRYDGGPATGAKGGRSGRSQAPLLNAAGEEQLRRKFEGLCGERSNFDALVAALGGR